MALHSNCMDLSFQEKKKHLEIRYLVAEILSKNPVLLFLGHPVNVKVTQNCFASKHARSQISEKDYHLQEQIWMRACHFQQIGQSGTNF